MNWVPRLWPAIVGASLSVCWAGACGTQGEGQYCDPLNVNADCDDGLTCSPGALTTNGVDYHVCCFPPGMNTTAACIQALSVNNGNTPTTADAGVDAAESGADTASPTTDATPDAATE
jgi:hypothetical protein